MPTPYTPAKIATIAWFVLALLGMVVGFRLSQTAYWFVGVVVAVVSCSSAIRGFGRLIRILAAEQVLLRGGAAGGLGGAHYRRFRQATLPQQIFVLLFSVAEVDGRAGENERNLVRSFLLERFVDPVVQQQLYAWNADPIAPDQISSLVHELRSQLSPPECETLFYWCCMVTLVDQRFHREEHELLQTVAHHLGLDPRHARRIFHHARLRVLAWAHGGDDRRGPRAGFAQREPELSPRERALAILGLNGSATPDDIRRRHRELVKKHHPDAHTHLGPVAQQEATERFREIQSAYETLTARA